MAVPFALPEEDEINNLITTVFFILSQTFLERIDDHHEIQERMEEFLRLFMEEYERRSNLAQCIQLRRTLHLLRENLRRRRSMDMSGFCDDAKLNRANDSDDCIQALRKIEEFEVSPIQKERSTIESVISSTTTQRRRILHNKELAEEDVINSRTNHSLIDVRRIFWCAVPLICIVGLHLFQTNYCM